MSVGSSEHGGVGFVDDQLELERSRTFFEDPQSYATFDLDKSLRRIIGCIDPRDQEQDTALKTVVQTAGGAVGEGVDMTIALRVSGEKPDATVQDGIAADHTVRHTGKLCAHHGCKYVQGLPTVLQEMATPTDFTKDTFNKWVRYYQLGDVADASTFDAVTSTAAHMAEETYDEEALTSFVDGLYPSPNIATMRGPNNARLYVVNHHPNAGLNRELKHRQEGLSIQGYHDSLGATISDLSMSRLPAAELRPRIAAHILRAAAVRTVIGGQPGEHALFLEVQATEHGPQVNEVQ